MSFDGATWIYLAAMSMLIDMSRECRKNKLSTDRREVYLGFHDVRPSALGVVLLTICCFKYSCQYGGLAYCSCLVHDLKVITNYPLVDQHSCLVHYVHLQYIKK